MYRGGKISSPRQNMWQSWVSFLLQWVLNCRYPGWWGGIVIHCLDVTGGGLIGIQIIEYQLCGHYYYVLSKVLWWRTDLKKRNKAIVHGKCHSVTFEWILGISRVLGYVCFTFTLTLDTTNLRIWHSLFTLAQFSLD